MAEDKYIGQYVSYIGEVAFIQSKKSFAAENDDARLTCSVTGSVMQEKVLNMKLGDTVQIKGKITALGTFSNKIDIKMKVYEIEIR